MPYVDKYLVRKHVAKYHPEVLVPLLGVYDNADDIDFDDLPQSFILKCTHGCKWNIPVLDKLQINEDDIRRRLDKWLTMRYNIRREPIYNFQGRIIAEQHLGEVRDYKLYIFHGEAKLIETFYGSFKDNVGVTFYDAEWNKLPVVRDHRNNPDIDKPKNLEYMVQVAETLGEFIDFVRVDMYNLDGAIYFGELTFIPADGRMLLISESYNQILGDYWHLDIK